MNYLSYIVPPLVGALIGYITNWIAVKMLFRPLKPIYIGKVKLPFTPGIIPKNKQRLAKSIAISINDNLLTTSDLSDKLLSDEVKTTIKTKVINFTKLETSLKDNFSTIVGTEKYTKLNDALVNKLTEVIYNSVAEANLGKIVSEQVALAAKEKLQGSLLGMFGAGSIISSVGAIAESKTNAYIEENGIFMIHEIIDKKSNELGNTAICDICSNIDIDLPQFILSIYEKIISQNIGIVIQKINIQKIIEDKINDMDMLELEKLILSIMKKELNALVALGALIGFVLGFVNILF
ncbi:MAG: DUF445 family protein [Clostridia bacterium]|nr:DUF445 family protein [Clostridia bacterium]